MLSLERFQEQIYFSTVRITVPNLSGPGGSVGTGFLVKMYLPELGPGTEAALLVSNKHVFWHKGALQLAFHRRHDERDEPVLGQVVGYTEGDFSEHLMGHPDPEVDLACVNVSTLVYNHPIYFRTILPSHYSDFAEPDLLPGVETWFVGYPDGRFDQVYNLPLMRRGYIASIPTLDFNGGPQFIIDAHVYPGSSGSPVFAVLGGQWRLLGVITQTMIKHQPVKGATAGAEMAIEQTLGLGIVLKMKLVQELLNVARQRIVSESRERRLFK